VLLLLSVASAAQLKQVAVIEIPGRPGFDAMAFSGKYLLIAHTGAGTVDLFLDVRDGAAHRVVALAQGGYASGELPGSGAALQFIERYTLRLLWLRARGDAVC